MLVDQCVIDMKDVSEIHLERLRYITLFLRSASKIIINPRFTIEFLLSLSLGYNIFTLIGQVRDQYHIYLGR